MAKSKCPHCSAEVQVGERPQLGQREVCGSCGKALEVVWLFPVALDYSGDNGVPPGQEKPRPGERTPGEKNPNR